MIIFPFLMRRRFDDNVLHVKLKLILLETPFLESLSCTHVLSCICYVVSCTLVCHDLHWDFFNFGTTSIYAIQLSSLASIGTYRSYNMGVGTTVNFVQ